MHIQGLEEVPNMTSLMLSKLEVTNDLFTCLTVSKESISFTIMQEEPRARLLVFHSSKALLDDIRNSKANFGDSCCNPKAQVLPSIVHSHPHDALFCLIQTRDDKGVDLGRCKVF
ncbi:hypothetical protein TB1_034199 [Malus domestica]